MSKWKSHPGGRVIYTHAGQDASSVFSSFHSKESWGFLQQYCIGDCSESLNSTDKPFERDVRALFPKMREAGVFTARCVCV